MSRSIAELRGDLEAVESTIEALERELGEQRGERDRLHRAIADASAAARVVRVRPGLRVVSVDGEHVEMPAPPEPVRRKPRVLAAASVAAAVAPAGADTVARLFRKFEPGQRIRAATAITYGERALTVEEGDRGRVHSVARDLPLMLIEWDDAPGVLLRTSVDAIDPVPAGEGTPCAP